MKACQDVSAAGLRQGLREGTRTGLWLEVARAVDELRPPLVVLENVLGLLSGRAHCDVEWCEGCMGDRADDAVLLRALGAVLGSLSSLGYCSAWETVSASDVGAPHKRSRVFILAAADPDCSAERACALEAWRGLVASVKGDAQS